MDCDFTVGLEVSEVPAVKITLDIPVAFHMFLEHSVNFYKSPLGL
jgi:hypothetical protein